MIKKTLIAHKIYLLIFPNQKDLASTFLRFQEHYESPKFRGKIFSLKEYKKWYVSQQGKFSYYTDWNGFNIPSRILKPFYLGKFDPLSNREKVLLDLFKKEKEDFYIIAILKKNNAVLNHEIAHGFYHTKSSYKKAVLLVLKKYNTTKLRKILIATSGYHKSVLDDEVHARACFPSKKYKAFIPKGLTDELSRIFKRQVKK